MMWPPSVRWCRCQRRSGQFARTAFHATRLALTSQAQLTLLYDGGCPLCVREVRFLRQRNQRGFLRFVDVDSEDYTPDAWAGITYRQAMARIHAIRADGTVLTDVSVFREAYRLIGLGWIYAPTTWPLLGALVDRVYKVWASQRLRLTGRADLETLCSERCRVRSIP